MTAAEAVAMFEANPELVESRAREKAARLVRARADNEAAREVYEDLAAVGGWRCPVCMTCIELLGIVP